MKSASEFIRSITDGCSTASYSVARVPPSLTGCVYNSTIIRVVKYLNHVNMAQQQRQCRSQNHTVMCHSINSAMEADQTTIETHAWFKAIKNQSTMKEDHRYRWLEDNHWNGIGGGDRSLYTRRTTKVDPHKRSTVSNVLESHTKHGVGWLVCLFKPGK